MRLSHGEDMGAVVFRGPESAVRVAGSVFAI
jgi:hypothetical protein